MSKSYNDQRRANNSESPLNIRRRRNRRYRKRVLRDAESLRDPEMVETEYLVVSNQIKTA